MEMPANKDKHKNKNTEPIAFPSSIEKDRQDGGRMPKPLQLREVRGVAVLQSRPLGPLARGRGAVAGGVERLPRAGPQGPPAY